MTPGSLPTLFVSHGAPTLALETGLPAYAFLNGLGKRFPDIAALRFSAYLPTGTRHGLP
ncbi:MAG: hypothetical protein WC620_04615 [Methanoregula sp.]